MSLADKQKETGDLLFHILETIQNYTPRVINGSVCEFFINVYVVLAAQVTAGDENISFRL